MQQLLKQYGLGKLDGTRIIIYPQINPSQLWAVFIPKRINYVCETMNMGWKYFLKRKHGYKVPTMALEPYIARYVKALSVCGVCMTESCDGNSSEQHLLWVKPQDSGDYLWCTTIYRCFMPKEFAIVWNTPGISVSLNNKNKYENYYKINKIAEHLYNHRLTICEQKKCIQKSILQFMHSYDIDVNSVKTFFNRINKIE